MSAQLPTAYLNGHFLPLDEARISPLDRGFLFGEGVYEVIPVYAGRPLNLDAHVRRLHGSLARIALPCPLDDSSLDDLFSALIERNGSGDLSIYLQITRGVAHGVRNHVFPDAYTPTVFGMCQSMDPRASTIASTGVAAITLEDDRWAQCDIKATSLLANTLARQRAHEAGAVEAILLREGQVTEGAASSVFVVQGDRVLQPPPMPGILPGTTAPFVVTLLKNLSVVTSYEPISEATLRGANELWLASSTREVLPVTTLDGKKIGAGVPGPLWQALDHHYQRAKRAMDPA